MESSREPLVGTPDHTSPLAGTLSWQLFKASPEPTCLCISQCGQASFVSLWSHILEGPVDIKSPFGTAPIS